MATGTDTGLQPPSTGTSSTGIRSPPISNRGGGGTGTGTGGIVMESNNNNTNGVVTTTGDDGNHSVLDVSEQTQRPIDNAINQQRIPAWHPILDPVFVIIGLFYLGVIMIPTGYKIDAIQRNVVEMKLTYDEYSKDYNMDTTLCGIGNNYNANRMCNITLTVPTDMTPPIFIHYEINNFHQNHRTYYKSRDPHQLLGRVGVQDAIDAEACKLLNKLGNMSIHPCGLIANTFFNDQFTLVNVEGDLFNNTPLIMREDGIAWQSDVDFAYAQPPEFTYSECVGPCDETCCNTNDSCIGGLPYMDTTTGKCYRYYYPMDDTTQYLYETYPNVINPIEGVTNEHFIVWMRIATQPKFRKLYGWFDQPIWEGTKLTFQIQSNWVVTRFRGSKSFVMSTTSIFGGRNPYLGPMFIYVGYFCIVAGIFFTLKHTVRPRKLADPSYLSYKEE